MFSALQRAGEAPAQGTHRGVGDGISGHLMAHTMVNDGERLGIRTNLISNNNDIYQQY